MKISMKNYLSVMVLTLAAAVMAACAGSDDTVADTPKLPENTGKVVTLTTTVGLGGAADETTRALTSGGVKTFAVGETMALVYESMSNKRTVKESEPLGAGDIAADGKSATFTFNLTEEPDKTQSVDYIYPAAMADADGNENSEALSTEQDGTLTKLASNFDFATTHTKLDWDGDNLPGATLENQLAILAITLKDYATGADITGSITGLTLTTRNDSHTESMTYNITRSAAPGPIYVAIYPTMNATINVTATFGAYTYTKTLEGKDYQASKGYNVSWRMTNTTPLTMEALTAGTIVVNDPQPGMQYSLNGGDKTTMSGNTTINVGVGDKVQFYGTGTDVQTYYWSSSDYTSIAGGTAEVKVYGNIMSLVNETGFATATTFESSNNFRNLFYGNDKLKDASGLLLPATTLKEDCYNNMFWGCTSLTTAPALPATTLADNCYGRMFWGCTKLTAAPALPATTLAEDCYKEMFHGCNSLETAPALNAETLANYCYHGMFHSCSSLENAPALPATTLKEGCYRAMFAGCTSLTAAPVLPAKTLVNRCYWNMFYGCTKLNAVTCLATDISAPGCTEDWLSGAGTQAEGTKTFTKAASMTDWPRNASGIPDGWTVQDAQ